MEMRTVLAANHIQDGIWCSCGERYSDCFVAVVLIPAMGIWREKQYAELFESCL